MYAQMIKNLEPSYVDEDTINGMKMLLDLDTFSDIHDLVKTKLKEIEDHKKQEQNSLVGAFKMEVGKYYRTVNNSVVSCYEECENDVGVKFYKMIILSGGHSTKEPQTLLSSLSGNNYNLYSGYVVNDVGQSVIVKNKDDPKFPMHIVKEIEVIFPD